MYCVVVLHISYDNRLRSDRYEVTTQRHVGIAAQRWCEHRMESRRRRHAVSGTALDCSSSVTSKTFDKMMEAPFEKEQPSLSHVNILPQVKLTSKGLVVVKEKPPVKKPSSVTATAKSSKW